MILDVLTPFGGSLSVRSRALRSGQLGSSEWGTLRWIIQYLMLDLLLAAAWAAPRRLHLLATKPTPCTKGSIKTPVKNASHTNGNPKQGTQKKLRGDPPPSQESSKPSPGGHLSTPPARRVGRRRPFFTQGHQGLLREEGVAPPRGRGGSGGGCSPLPVAPVCQWYVVQGASCSRWFRSLRSLTRKYATEGQTY